MCLADGGVVITVFGLFLVGIVGFVAVIVSVIARVIRGAGHALTGWAGGEDERRTGLDDRRICRDDHCRHVNPAHARYCGRCGRRLDSVT